MHMQSLMLIHPRVLKKMHLQENILFDLDLGSGAQYPLHYVTYASANIEVATANGLGEYTITE